MIKEKVFLTQTDTTIGFVSQNAEKLTKIKQRPPHKHYIKAVNLLQTLKTFTRVPTLHKNRVRRAKKSTFIFPNGNSYRVVHNTSHLLLLKRFGWLYTTSANQSGEAYNEIFAKKAASVVVTPQEAVQKASNIYKLSTYSLKRIR